MTKKSKDKAETPVEVDATAAAEAAQGAASGEAGGDDTVAPEGDKLAEELAAARTEVLDSRDRMLRMAAELENFKKRTAREKETSLRYAEENILKELLPSLDNLERAIEQGQAGNGEAGSLLEGVEMTLKGLLASLDKFGLKSIESVGQPFDPNFHEALGMEAGGGAAPNTVLKEFQKGYLFKERLLRAAKVIVAAG